MIDLQSMLMAGVGAIAGGAAGYVGKSLVRKIGVDAANPAVKRAMETLLTQFELRLETRFIALRTDIVREINGTYVRSAGSTLTGAEIERALERLIKTGRL